MIGIDQIRQPVGAENDNVKITECDEFGMPHVEGAAIGQIESKGTKPVTREFAQLIDVHRLNFITKPPRVTTLNLFAGTLAKLDQPPHHAARIRLFISSTDITCAVDAARITSVAWCTSAFGIAPNPRSG